MGKQVLYSILIVIMGFAAGTAWTQEADPSLMGWWTFDGDALDASGNGRNGLLGGDPQFVTGVYGEALEFDGDDSVTIAGYKGIEGTQPFSIAAWIRTDSTATKTIVTWGTTSNGAKIELRIINNILRVNHGAGNVESKSIVSDGRWHHIALTVQENSTCSYPEMTLYVDGQDDTDPSTDADPPLDIVPDYDVGIGYRSTNSDRYWEGLIDEVRIYDRVITAAEVAALAMRPKAYDPEPADGTIGVTNPLLSWQPRPTAISHSVYLGTTPDLGEADLVSSGLPMTLYWHTPGLESRTTYYWRVDEVDPDGSVHTGDVWMFVFSPNEAWMPVPADREPYTDPNVTLSWLKGLNGLSHEVYFGADETQVAEGTGDTFKGKTYETSFVTGDLEMATTYYWRVDEVDQSGAKVTGNVWSFTTLPEIPITDPNLRGWWKMDVGLGSRAVDWSGHGGHGEFAGEPLWVEGYDGSALEFDGVDDSVIYSFDAVEDWSAFTVSLWVKAATLGQNQYSSPFSSHTPNTGGFQIDVDGLLPGSYRVNYSGGSMVIGAASTDWVHLAVTATGTAAKLYHNGVWMASTTLPDALFNEFAIGVNRNIANWFAGTIDDLRVFDRELSQEEIELAMRIDPLRAWNPSPADASVADVRTAAPLTWTRGDNASQHDVYFGTDKAAVTAADATDTSGIYRGRLGATSYTPSEGIEWGQGYFWRVDEINTDGSITAGRVWRFTVADYLIVDDFESYTNESPNRVFQAWIDGLGFSPDDYFPDGSNGNGTGALVGHDVWSLESPHYNGTIMETDSVYSGRQAMPLYYDNSTTPYESETTRTWAAAQNWTFNDVNTLVVYFQGAPVDFLQTADAITMSAAGADIWDVADEFRYAHKQLNGDGAIIVRVDSIANTHASAKAGVMIRESLEPGSRHAMVVVTPTAGVKFERRLATGSTSVGTTETGIVAPHWVKLTRMGNELIAQHSADGVSWVDVGPDPAASQDTVVMGGSLYIGLALTSHSAGNPTTAAFSQIQTTGGVSGAWEVAEIGVDHPGNSPAGLYVTVEDTAGRSGSVLHPDGTNAVLSQEWRPWAVDLSEFLSAGVNLQAVRTMTIGVGDPTNPQPDGTGMALIDDIRIMQGAPEEPNDVQ